jgi:site-specific recombinase XerD
MENSTSLTRPGEGFEIALRNALDLWADATTHSTSHRREELMHDKRVAVIGFFSFVRKHPAAVKSADVRLWREDLESKGLKPATIYARVSRLSSFYEWAMRAPQLRETITSNPVRLARPKAPRAYQTESVQSLSDDQVRRLVTIIREKAKQGSVVAKRDYALLLFYLLTGMRRSEVMSLRGRNVEEREGVLIVRSKVKGSDYVEREVRDSSVQAALIEYLTASGRAQVLARDSPVWTRHDRAGRPGAALTSHAFAHNLKRYAEEAGIKSIHVHQMRHTYARMVAEDTGSITETQDALGHRNVSTTRVYVQRIAVKRDKHSERISLRVLNQGDS